MTRELLTIKTTRNKQVVDISEHLRDLLGRTQPADGLLQLSVMHTTAALTAADLDPGTDLDMLDAFYGMLPDMDFRHPHNPEHAPDHILAALIGPDLTIPVEKGGLMLGTWQSPVLIEFDGPRERRIAATCLSFETT